jgi:hypothetical protein
MRLDRRPRSGTATIVVGRLLEVDPGDARSLLPATVGDVSVITEPLFATFPSLASVLNALAMFTESGGSPEGGLDAISISAASLDILDSNTANVAKNRCFFVDDFAFLSLNRTLSNTLSTTGRPPSKRMTYSVAQSWSPMTRAPPCRCGCLGCLEPRPRGSWTLQRHT